MNKKEKKILRNLKIIASIVVFTIISAVYYKYYHHQKEQMPTKPLSTNDISRADTSTAKDPDQCTPTQSGDRNQKITYAVLVAAAITAIACKNKAAIKCMVLNLCRKACHICTIVGVTGILIALYGIREVVQSKEKEYKGIVDYIWPKKDHKIKMELDGYKKILLGSLLSIALIIGRKGIQEINKYQ